MCLGWFLRTSPLFFAFFILNLFRVCDVSTSSKLTLRNRGICLLLGSQPFTSEISSMSFRSSNGFSLWSSFHHPEFCICMEAFAYRSNVVQSKFEFIVWCTWLRRRSNRYMLYVYSYKSYLIPRPNLGYFYILSRVLSYYQFKRYMMHVHLHSLTSS